MHSTVTSFVVGITGGIGSGKSAATDYLATLGITIVDADVAARIVVSPGQPALAAIAKNFGQHLIQADGGLDRRTLRKLVFDDKQQLKQLEAITHPAIETEIKRQLQQSTSPYTVLVSPLLLTTAQRQLVNRVLLIDVPDSLQIERAMKRDGSSEAQIRAIMSHQLTRQQRQQRSDDIIINDQSLEKLQHSLYPLHQHYLTLART